MNIVLFPSFWLILNLFWPISHDNFDGCSIFWACWIRNLKFVIFWNFWVSRLLMTFFMARKPRKSWFFPKLSTYSGLSTGPGLTDFQFFGLVWSKIWNLSYFKIFGFPGFLWPLLWPENHEKRDFPLNWAPIQGFQRVQGWRIFNFLVSLDWK